MLLHLSRPLLHLPLRVVRRLRESVMTKKSLRIRSAELLKVGCGVEIVQLEGKKWSFSIDITWYTYEEYEKSLANPVGTILIKEFQRYKTFS
ncbi:hypothetical protein MTR_6g463870 [Medicago truncatula]|uniref:Uncharacterized protein n=1 Tax=Medicago truncatula TaxID=3880 RepID=A0A072UAT1_MEDTR|nr:hypothetical protein MTR_6g463870 [Medicago truncatula]